MQGQIFYFITLLFSNIVLTYRIPRTFPLNSNTGTNNRKLGAGAREECTSPPPPPPAPCSLSEVFRRLAIFGQNLPKICMPGCSPPPPPPPPPPPQSHFHWYIRCCRWRMQKFFNGGVLKLHAVHDAAPALKKLLSWGGGGGGTPIHRYFSIRRGIGIGAFSNITNLTGKQRI